MPSKASQQLEEFTEKLTRYIPKPLLPGVVLLLAIGGIMLYQKPHTICDTIADTLRANQDGILFPTRINRKMYPAKIIGVMESCRTGNSAGSCFEYFGILRRLAISIKDSNTECIPELMGLNVNNYARTEFYESVQDGDRVREDLAEVRYTSRSLGVVLQDGLEMLVRKAWGDSPPEVGPLRFGWLQESELAVFCHLQDVLRRAKGPEEWPKYVKSVMAKLPGEKRAEALSGSAPIAPQRPATELMPETDIRQRSLFSVSCGAYR